MPSLDEMATTKKKRSLDDMAESPKSAQHPRAAWLSEVEHTTEQTGSPGVRNAADYKETPLRVGPRHIIEQQGVPLDYFSPQESAIGEALIRGDQQKAAFIAAASKIPLRSPGVVKYIQKSMELAEPSTRQALSAFLLGGAMGPAALARGAAFTMAAPLVHKAANATVGRIPGVGKIGTGAVDLAYGLRTASMALPFAAAQDPSGVASGLVTPYLHPIASIKKDPVGTLFAWALPVYLGARGIAAHSAVGRELPPLEAARLESEKYFQEESEPAPTPKRTTKAPKASESKAKPVSADAKRVTAPQSNLPHPQVFADMMVAKAREHGQGVVDAKERVRQSYDAFLDKSDAEQEALAKKYGVTPQEFVEQLKQTMYHIDKQIKAPETVVQIDKSKIHEALADGPKSVDEIVQATGYPVNRVLAQLTMGELNKELVRGDDGTYTVVPSETQLHAVPQEVAGEVKAAPAPSKIKTTPEIEELQDAEKSVKGTGMRLTAAKKKSVNLASETGAVSLAPLIEGAKALSRLTKDLKPIDAILAAGRAFREEDIKPRTSGSLSGVGETIKQISPGTFAPEGAQKLRSELGYSAMMRSRVMDALNPIVKKFDRLAADHPAFGVQVMDFIDTADRRHIDRTVNPDALGKGYDHIFQAVNSIRKTLVTLLDEQHEKERAVLDPLFDLVGRDRMGERKNYFPLMEKSSIAESGSTSLPASIFHQIFGGGAGFTRHREFETHSDFLAAGHQLASTNPAELAGMRLFEGEKARLASSYVLDSYADGRAALVPHYGAGPEGYRPLEGPLFSGKNGLIWLPEGEARLINNLTSSGLSRSKLFRSLRVTNNSLNQLQLGLSGYHGMTTVLNVGATRVGMAAEELLSGNIKGAASNFGKALIAPVDTAALIKRGDTIKKAYRTGEGEAVGTAEKIAQAGGRIGMDPATMGFGQGASHTSAYGSMVRAWQRGNKIGAILRSPMAATEMLASPIFSHMVPDVKLSLAEQMMAQELARVPEATEAEQIAIRQKVWDTLDNRFGQMVYDNLFWNATMKNLATLGVRAVGWNVGTAREFGGAAADVGTSARALRSGKVGQALSMRQAYSFALPLYIGTIGGTITKLATGENPTTIDDFLAPRIGGKNEDGTDRRVVLASYMKEFEATRHRAGSYANPVSGAVAAVGETAMAKASPLLEALDQVAHNRDSRGVQIWNLDADLETQFKQTADFLEEQLKPIGVRNTERYGIADARSIGSFIGVTPATREESRSDAMNALDRLWKSHLPAVETRDDLEKREARQPIANKIKAGTITRDDVQKAFTDRLFSNSGAWSRFYNRVLSTPKQLSVQKFKSLSQSEQDVVWSKATKEERNTFAQYRKGVPQWKRAQMVR